MSDHSFDVDHNYYSQGLRQSQIPDYDVNQEPPPDSISTLPAYTYRQSQEIQRKRPTVTTDFDHNASNAPDSSSSSSAVPAPYDDPHLFYRQYRDSFIRQAGSVYGSLDNNRSSIEEGMTTAARTSQRTTPVAARQNGYPASPMPTMPVSARWKDRMDNHTTSSPLSDRTPASGRRANQPPVHFPRGRQTSLQALVNRFNQNLDEVPPAPPSKNSSRSTSANNSPSNVSGPKTFRSRASLETSQAGHGSPKHRLPAKQDSRPTQAQSGRRRTNNANNAPAVKISKITTRGSAAVKTGNLTSQSMVDLNPTSPDSSRKPLFGEVVKADAGLSNPGYGIPVPRRRRGSEGSMHQPNPMFQEEPLTVKVSPSSPTAWYMGVTPSLDGIDLNKPVPARPLGMHRRSRSDIVSSSFTIAPLSSAPGKAITILSPPQEQPTPSPSPTAVKRTSQSRIPISTRRMSATSDSGNSTNSPRASYVAGHQTGPRGSQSRNPSTRPNPIHPPSPAYSTRSSTPRRSPRHRNQSPPRQPSPRLPAYISEQVPLKSPPLRSSRPRQPVSSASTSASRARAAAVLADQGPSKPRDKPQKKLPEVATVDFAARRQRIHQAFTKSMIEAELEEERKRASMLHSDPLPVDDRGDSLAFRLARLPEVAADPSASPDQEGETFTTPAEEKSKAESELTIDTSLKINRTMLVLDTEDSPTLGTAKFIGSSAGPQDDSTTPEPSSAVTTGTEETFFDNEPQVDSHPVAKSQEIPDGLAPPVFEGRTHSLYGSDRDDAESIQIMLRGTPVSARGTGFDGSRETPAPGSEERWSTSEQESPSFGRVDERTPSRNRDDHHASMSSAASPNEQLWSPESTASFMSGNTTLDGDSYSTITRVFDSYHDPNLMSPENITELQRRMASQSPSLARAGGWDAKKVTQIYLQQLREKGQDTSAIPKPLNVPFNASKTAPVVVKPTDSDGAENDLSAIDGAKDEVRHEAADDDHAVDGLAVPSRVLNLQRASLTNPDDWANTSPSMLDWMSQAVDTPTDEKDDQVGRQVRGWVTGISELEKTQTARDDRPVLPDIPRSGGLGININVESPPDGLAPGVPEVHGGTDHRASPLRSVQPPRSPVRKPASSSSSMNKSFQTSTQSGSLGPSTTPGSPSRSRPEDLSDPPVTARPLAEINSTVTEQQGDSRPSLSSEHSNKSRPATSELQKRLTRRRHIIEELVNTESSFSQDMTVVVDIYKGTSNVILNSPDDVKTLFGNAHDVVAFSTTFLDSLKTAAKSVYLLPKSKRWRSKRDSNATTESTNTDDQSSIGGIDLTDEDKDRKTSIGSAFLKNLSEMERVYAEYLRNHDAANQKLQQLQKAEKIQIWLRECQTYASDLTTAWDLDSLLVKPVQRLLKYSLFLKDLVEVTADNHPDFVPLDTACREMLSVSHRINEAKKRAELLEQVNGAGSGSKKRKDYEGRLAFPKAFGRRSEKLKQQVGLSDMVQDRDYNQVADKFGSHFFQLQVVMRDVEMYVMDVQTWVNSFNDVVLGIEAYMDVGQTTYPNLESKWRRFRLSMRELQMTALVDHINAVRKNVIDPMTTLLKLHDGPQRLMDKRKKRVMDFAKYKAVKDRGEKPDKKTAEQGEQFLAINETLKDELPKLFSLTGKLVEACLNNYVQLQLQWQSVWKRKLVQAIELHEVPRSFSAIFVDFSGDFRYTEAQVLSLGVCNGSLLADTANLVNLSYLTPSTTLNDDDSSRRPSIATDGSRTRAPSTTAENPRVRQYSASSGLSPMLPSPDFGRPTEGFGLGPHLGNSAHQPGTGRRVRASSTASSRSPVTPDVPGGWRTYGNVPSQASSHSNRPSTSTGRSHETHSLPVPNRGGEGQVEDQGGGRLRPDSESSRFMAPRQAPVPNKRSSQSDRASGVFSSAMPMSDSPRAQSPENDGEHVPQYKVLFLAASVYEFNIDRARREAGYPYLTYVAGEIFDVIGEKGELWLAKNQDDDTSQVGWIWNKHFAKLAS